MTRLPRRLQDRIPLLKSLSLLGLVGTLIIFSHGGLGQASVGQRWSQGVVSSSQAGGTVQPRLEGAVLRNVNRLVRTGKSRGLNPRVFMKVGDSNSWFPTYLQGAGCGPMRLAGHSGLRGTIDWFRGGHLDPSMTDLPCGVGNPFTRDSAATKSCEESSWPLSSLPTPPGAPLCNTPPPTECADSGTPLDCEARLLEPSLALVMIGTNDAGAGVSPGEFEANLRAIVRRLEELSIVPVLSTIPPRTDNLESKDLGESLNRRIRKVAVALEIPMLDLWLALTRHDELVGGGLFPDGVHLNVFGGWGFGDWTGKSMYLGPKALRFGANIRNLLTLKLLKRLRQQTAL